MPGIIGPFYDVVTLGLTRTASGASGRFVWFPGSRFENFGEYKAIIQRLNNQSSEPIMFGLSKRLIILAHGTSNLTNNYVKTPPTQLIGFFSESGSMYNLKPGAIALGLIQAPWGIDWSKGSHVEEESLIKIGVRPETCGEYYFDILLGEDYPGSNGFGLILEDLQTLIVSPNTLRASSPGSPFGYASSKKLECGSVNIEDFHEFHEKSHRDRFGELLVHMVSAFQRAFHVPDQILPLCSAVTADVLLVDCLTSVSEVVSALNGLGIIYPEILVSACRGFHIPESSRLWPAPSASIASTHVALAKSRRMQVGRTLFLSESSLNHVIEFWYAFKKICEKWKNRPIAITARKTVTRIPELPGFAIDLSREDERLARQAFFEWASHILETYRSLCTAIQDRQTL